MAEKTYNIVYETCPWHTRVALFNDEGKLLSLKFEDVDDAFVEGTVLLGRVRTLMPSLNAAFVDIGDIQDGFLPLNKVPRADRDQLHEGQAILVRIDRPRSLEKGAKLDGRVLHEMPKGDVKNPSVVEHAPSALSRLLLSAGAHPVNVHVVDSHFISTVQKFIAPERIFEVAKEDEDWLDRLDAQIEMLGSQDFQIGGGAHLTIESTKALTSIDVDSGGYIRKNHEQNFLEINTLAAREVVRLCKLLNLGGNIIVDFITMRPKENRRQIRNLVKNYFSEIDSKRVEILEMSRFGLLEINREREGEMLLETLKKPMFVAGEIILKLWRVKKDISGTVKIEASFEVAEILKKRLTQSACLAYMGCEVDVVAKPEIKIENYQIHT